VHGTTIATNAILERRGARCALLTTLGFRDVLEFRRLRVPSLYGNTWSKPPPLIPRRYRCELDERIAADGQIVRPLDPIEVRAVVAELAQAGIESIAVCLINSYVNPMHERQVEEIIRNEFPSICLSLSADILPEIQEYERTSTTVANAYVMPLLRHYLTRISDGLIGMGIHEPMLIMQSNGGLLTISETIQRPVHVIESGPAAGLMASARLAQELKEDRLLAFDMGGTTAKAALIENARPTRTHEFEIGGTASSARKLTGGDGYLIRSTVLDLVEIGQGGGSIAWLDSAGGLHVGPESAGSEPGPSCYDRGGTRPTVTDANLILGYFDAERPLGGKLILSRPRAEAAIKSFIADPLELSVLDAAWGIHRIAIAGMTRGLKAVSIERGRDPRAFTLLAYGGSGPLHAVGIAEGLGIKRVLVPPVPGVFSAVGLLFSGMEVHEAQTCLGALAHLRPERIEAIRAGLRSKAMLRLKRAGVAERDIVFEEAADLRYAGQTYELTIAAPRGELNPSSVAELERAFGDEHMRVYGHRGREQAVELVTWRMTARGGRESGKRPFMCQPFTRIDTAMAGVRKVSFGPSFGVLDAMTLGRSHLKSGPYRGPLIIEEYDSTTIVPPGWTAVLDGSGAVVITSDRQGAIGP
jgi:N-methylhydantoinase A